MSGHHLRRLRPARLRSLALGLALVLAGIAPALNATGARQPALAASGPADGMLLFIAPGPGGLPPNTLHRVYPDNTGKANVAFDQPLDVRRALISPDGGRFAIYAMEAGNIGRIYIGVANGTSLEMIPVDATHMGLEDWHPQGAELLVWHFSEGQYDLKRLSLGGQLTPLTNTPGVDERNGRWSPDGTRFSFTAAGVGGQTDVFVQTLGGSPVNVSQSPEAEGAAEWSPSGARLVYAHGGGLVVSDPSGANSTALTVAKPLLGYGWSPAGEIYASDVDGGVLTAADDGSTLTSLLALGANNWVSDWGPASTGPLTLLPEHVAISVEQGASNPAPVTVMVGSADFVTPWSATSGASWLNVNPSSGETPGEVQLSFTTSTLNAGLYAAPVTFLPGPKTLNVLVAVNEPGALGNLLVIPDALAFTGTAGASNPIPSSIAVTSTGAPVNWVATSSASWLSLSTASGVTPANITASVDTTGMAAGHYEGVLHFEPGGRQVTVSLDLVDPAQQPDLIVTPEFLAFTAIVGDPAPAGRQLSISSAGGEVVAWSAVTSADWLQLSAYSGITPGVVEVLVDPTGLPPGSHTGTVWIGPRAVPVTLTVLSETSPPAQNIIVTPRALGMASIQGGAPPGVKDLEIASATGQPVEWRASASQPWLILSATGGTTPATLKVRADASGLQPGSYSATITVDDTLIPVNLTVLASAPSAPQFYDTWSRQDLPVQAGLVNRTWLWGPGANGTMTESYAESPTGRRTVEYHDKSRMEITHPDADPSEGWYVTNGLLAYELITGEMQLGDNLFIQGTPSDIPVAGDADDVTGPRYTSFGAVLDAPALPQGSVVTQTINALGVVGTDPALSTYGVTVTGADPITGHTIASVFWDYLNSDGLIWTGSAYLEGPLFEPWFFATGLPVTEPYWAQVKVRGVVQDVLVQCFERRCLTYTPANPAGWQVEQGNVGMHYFRWRYERPGHAGPDPPVSVP